MLVLCESHASPSGARLKTELLQSSGRENCRLHGVSDLVEPLYSSFWPSAGLLTEFCKNKTSSVSPYILVCTCTVVCSCFLLLSLNMIATLKREQAY